MAGPGFPVRAAAAPWMAGLISPGMAAPFFQASALTVQPIINLQPVILRGAA